jgi:hypothetical protein
MHMMRRTCRLSATVLFSVLIACLASGCFGGGEEPVDTVPVTTTEASVLIDGLPSEYVNALGKRPIVVLFYSPGGIDDEKVLSVVRELRSAFSSYTFLMYDYRIPAAYGDLSQELDIGSPPQIVLTDSKGVRQDVWSGIIDRGTLNQSLLNLGRH